MKTSSPEDADILVQRLPSDMGIHRNPRKGTLNAPEKILEDFEFKKAVLVDEVFPNEFDLQDNHNRIEESTNDLMKYEKPLLSIGGDHSVSFPVVKALKSKYPDLQLVWLDAHLDLKKKVGENISHDVVVRELLDNGLSEGEIWFVGITRIDQDEEEFLEEHDLKVFEHDELEKFKREFVSTEQPVYLSVDIDVLKADLAPGTGYPDGELKLEQVESVIECVKPEFADLVEVAPSLDKEEATIRNSRKILETLEKQIKTI